MTALNDVTFYAVARLWGLGMTDMTCAGGKTHSRDTRVHDRKINTFVLSSVLGIYTITVLYFPRSTVLSSSTNYTMENNNQQMGTLCLTLSNPNPTPFNPLLAAAPIIPYAFRDSDGREKAEYLRKNRETSVLVSKITERNPLRAPSANPAWQCDRFL